MSRNTWHIPSDKREAPRFSFQGGQGYVLALCGQPVDGFGHYTATENSPKVCSKCAAIRAQANLLAREAGGEKPTLVLAKFTGESPYRSTYEVLYAGRRIGFVVYDGAYGRGAWKVCGQHTQERHPVSTEVHDWVERPQHRHGGYERKLEFNSKEDALIKAEELHQAGRLPFVETLIQQAEERKQRAATEEAERLERRAKARAEADMALEVVQQLLDASLVGPHLTDVQREGLTHALRFITSGAPA